MHGLKDNTVKMAVLPKVICRFNAVKIPAGFFAESDKLILKFTRKRKGPGTAKTILKMKSWGTHTS